MFASGPIKFGPAHDAAKLAGSGPTVDAQSLVPSDRPEPPRYPNQFMVLFLNLLIADLHQATAFFLSISWVVRDKVDVQTKTCFAQGFFVSTGDLSSSLFMSAIAIHTFYSIVYKYRPPHKNLYYYILFIWIFVYLISLLPVAGTLNGASASGFFVRAGAWVSHMPPSRRASCSCQDANFVYDSAGLIKNTAISVCSRITFLSLSLSSYHGYFTQLYTCLCDGSINVAASAKRETEITIIQFS